MTLFEPVPKSPEFPALEREILQFWKDHDVFAKRVAANRGGAKFRFFDGPITANNPMGVHHAWGRTYKDIFQRYHALCGRDQRYQNGFDCQGLWLEVEVEKALGFNSKPEILEFGLDRFSEACRARVDKFAAVQTEQSIRLGQWMDWPNSYYTMSDTNIEYIWHFLRVCHERGWLYVGHRPMPWCTRCGSSLSQHETAEGYREIEHTAVYVQLPVQGEPGTYFLVWTTTPWTLAANVALAVNPALDYVEARQGDRTLILSSQTVHRLVGPYEIVATVKGADLVGKRYDGPIAVPARDPANRVVIPWSDVAEEEGTGIVHIAPGCGAEDFELSKVHGLAVIDPVDEGGVYADPAFGEFVAKTAFDVAPAVFAHLEARGWLYRTEPYVHSYPHCWRCGKELIFRLVDEWFISCQELRPRMLEANRAVEWIPDYIGKRMEDWLNNMGDWCISRKRFWGLPLPFYPCACGHLNVIGSRKELEERAVEGLEGLRELHRPWIDDVPIRCASCGDSVRRLAEVGDCWLDAGIIPFSTLGYLDPGDTRWQEWFPADFICEMREQVRLWFYSLLFMSVTLVERAPYRTVLTYESVVDEKGGKFSKTKGNAIWFDEAVEKIGADVMRWMYAAQPITANLRFGWGPAQEVTRKLLTLWNVFSFFTTYANEDRPDLSAEVDPAAVGELDRWILARTDRLVRVAREGLDRYDVQGAVREAERFLEDLSNWYVRRSRRRFWKGTEAEGKAAFATLYDVLLTAIRVLSPIAPFATEAIYRNLRRARPGLPESVHLLDYPAPRPAWADDGLVADMAVVQRLAGLGLAARNEAKIRVRRPLRSLGVQVDDPGERAVIERMRAIVAEEVNVKEVRFADDLSRYVDVELKPDFRKLGPRLGPAVKEVAGALRAGAVAAAAALDRGEPVEVELSTGKVALAPDELVLKRTYRKGFAGAADRGVAVILDTEIDAELEREGLAREIVRTVNQLRKDADFAVADRIELEWSADGILAEAFEAHGSTIAGETLAVRVERRDAPQGERVEPFDLEEGKITIGVRRVPT